MCTNTQSTIGRRIFSALLPCQPKYTHLLSQTFHVCTAENLEIGRELAPPSDAPWAYWFNNTTASWHCTAQGALAFVKTKETTTTYSTSVFLMNIFIAEICFFLLLDPHINEYVFLSINF